MSERFQKDDVVECVEEDTYRKRVMRPGDRATVRFASIKWFEDEPGYYWSSRRFKLVHRAGQPPAPTVAELQATLAERDATIARLTAERDALDAENDELERQGTHLYQLCNRCDAEIVRLTAERHSDYERAIEGILLDACELPDRSSPEDQPEMLLITGEELDMLLRRHLGLEDAALAQPAPKEPDNAGA